MSRRVPPGDVLAAIYEFGPPRRVAMLSALLMARGRELQWRRYMADMAYNAVALLFGGDPGVPTYGAALGARDERSEAEVAADVLRRIEDETV